MLALALCAAAYGVWLSLEGRIRSAPQYQLDESQIRVTPPPEWIRTDVRAEALQMAGIHGPLSILQDDLLVRIQQAFAQHAWVARVVRVTRRLPPQVIVELEYRRPVLMVEVPGGLLAVDVEAVPLPSEDFTPEDVGRYPRLGGVRPATEGPLGTVWNDPQVAAAAQIGAALVDDWQVLDLWRILPLEGGPLETQQAPQFELRTRDGQRIIWGSGSAESARQKAARLRRIHAEHGGTWPDEAIDLRTPQERRLATRPAAQKR
jgi:cell division septal protein FtsQ